MDGLKGSFFLPTTEGMDDMARGGRTPGYVFAALLLTALAAMITLMSTGCSSVFFYPSREMRTNPFIHQFDNQDVDFQTTDGLTLHAWFFKAKEPVGSILVLHGNAENISTH